MNNTKCHPRPDKKAKCSFKQLLCVEFDAIFDVNVEIDDNSVRVSCGPCEGPGGFLAEEDE